MKTKEKQLETDVVVVGAGPAGLGLTHALLERGVDTICVAPELAPWAPTYGSWADELVGLDIPVRNQWANALVSFPHHDSVLLERPYVRLDSAALFRNWAAAIQRRDAFTGGSVSSALFSADFAQIDLDSGLSISARQIFDASGHRPKLVSRSPMGPAFQTAFGVTTPAEGETLGEGTMGLMIWDNGLESAESNAFIPAFYYAMPESDETTFCEYTVLASRPMVPVASIERRVREDFNSDQFVGDDLERCIIPMGYPVPDLEQRVVGFGGAASMVHPATGYMVARVLRTIPELADAYVAHRHLDADARARALWDVVWPTQRVRTHELFRFGLEALLTMNVQETHAFFAAFFALPDELWRPYQAGTATPAEVAAAMWGVFRRVDAPLKRKLIAAGFSEHFPKLTRLLF